MRSGPYLWLAVASAFTSAVSLLVLFAGLVIVVTYVHRRRPDATLLLGSGLGLKIATYFANTALSIGGGLVAGRLGVAEYAQVLGIVHAGTWLIGLTGEVLLFLGIVRLAGGEPRPWS